MLRLNLKPVLIGLGVIAGVVALVLDSQTSRPAARGTIPVNTGNRNLNLTPAMDSAVATLEILERNMKTRPSHVSEMTLTLSLCGGVAGLIILALVFIAPAL